ncbi:hypothetical protein FQA39_LY06419 [Lamprigera yunnana]|nr:hypothetical protein FQA39_LY06419 [Lamprigera yunnana]
MEVFTANYEFEGIIYNVEGNMELHKQLQSDHNYASEYFTENAAATEILGVAEVPVNYDMAEEKLSYLLQTNAKEVELSGGSITSWTKKVIDSPLNDDSESDVERESQVLLSQHTPKRLFHSNEEFLRLSRSSTASSVIGCAINTPSIDSVLSQHSRPVNIMSDFENSVLPSLLRINKTIKQHSIILQQLLRKSENSEFKNFDSSFENKEDLHQYMIRRLAAVVVIESVWLREGL